jgi:ribosomal protein S7
MPRRREVPKRDILPDPKFGSVDLSKFVNVLMASGKKSVAERIIYGAFSQIQTKSGKDPLEVFTLAVNNVKPSGRGQEPSRRRCELPGSGRGSSFPAHGLVDALAS